MVCLHSAPLPVLSGLNPAPLPTKFGHKQGPLPVIIGHNQAPLTVIFATEERAFQLIQLKYGSDGVLDMISRVRVPP